MKNASSIHEHHKQLFYTFQHFESYSPIQVKIGVIKSTVLPLERNSNTERAFIIRLSILQLNKELKLLGYPPLILINTIKLLYYTKRIKIYQLLLYILKLLKKYS